MPDAGKHEPGGFPLTSSTSPLDLGTLSQIFQRSLRGCPFCNLVVRSVQDKDPNDKEIEELVQLRDSHCHLTWQLDGRKIKTSGSGKSQSVRGFTRRIHLAWKDERLQDAYLAFVPKER